MEAAYQEIDERIELHLASFDKVLERMRENYRNQLLQAKQDARVSAGQGSMCTTNPMHLNTVEHERTTMFPQPPLPPWEAYYPHVQMVYAVRVLYRLQEYVEGAIERWSGTSAEILTNHQKLEECKQIIGAFSSTVATGRCLPACVDIEQARVSGYPAAVKLASVCVVCEDISGL